VKLFDAIASVEGGILRGQGRQHLGGIANVIVYWFIALPAGLTLAFKFDWGLYGLWAGMVSLSPLPSLPSDGADVRSCWRWGYVR
jgi:Na+-driven multidrug efflux pump